MSTTGVLLFSSRASAETESARLAASITRQASAQTYTTIRFLADRNLVDDAFRAYAYFRWVDDVVDADAGSKLYQRSFLARQQALLEACYRGEDPGLVCPQEQMLVDLVQHDPEKNSGLHSYLYKMMDVMAFDLERRGCTITQTELDAYTETLATAVTDALHYFIGHTCPPPCRQARYLAVQGAHIIHMLRDMDEDIAAGYYNVPSEAIQDLGISLNDVGSPAFRTWVKQRVRLARNDFDLGKAYIRQVKNLRCRLAGFAYTARFEWMLRAIEQDGYRLRQEYPGRKSLAAGLWMAWNTLAAALSFS